MELVAQGCRVDVSTIATLDHNETVLRPFDRMLVVCMCVCVERERERERDSLMNPLKNALVFCFLHKPVVAL